MRDDDVTDFPTLEPLNPDLYDFPVCERCGGVVGEDDETWCERFGTVHRDCEHESDCRCKTPRTTGRW